MQSQNEVLGVLLVGPPLPGSLRAGSHHDLIIIVEQSPWAPWQRPGLLPQVETGFHCEKIVFTREEFHRLRLAGNFFIRRALAEGEWLAREEARPEPLPSRPSVDSPGCLG